MPSYSPAYLEYELRLATLPVRKLLAWERDVLCALAAAAGLAAGLTAPEALDNYWVRELPGHGDGSIRFVTPAARERGQLDVATLFYTDADGVLASFSLDLDRQGAFWQIEAMKIDGSPLQRPPVAGDLRMDC
jgi:hypothetical protein